MNVKRSTIISLSAISLAQFASADLVEGELKDYKAGASLSLVVAKKQMTFKVSKKTLFQDYSGKSYPELSDAANLTWKIAKSVRVTYHSVGNTKLAELIQLPFGPVDMSQVDFGRVDPSLVKKGGAGPSNSMVMKQQMPTLKVRIGQPMPDFTLRSLTGLTLSSKQLKGKVIVLDFWATWCGPCKLMSPVMQSIHKKFSSKGVVVIGASTDQSLAPVQSYVKAHGYTYSFAMAMSLSERLGIAGIPFVVTIDRKGVVRSIQEGFEPGCDSKLDQQVAKLAGER